MSQTPDSVSPSILCAGILVADIFVPPLPTLPAAGELRATEDFVVDTGGCAANTATCLARLGVPTAVAGKVGTDLFGDFIARDLQAKGVETSGIQRTGAFGTSKTVILPVIGEDRRFIHTFGANADFRVSDIDRTLLSQVRLLCVGGYLIMPGFAQAELADLFRAARARGVKTVLDVVVPAGDSSRSVKDLAEVLPYTDYFLPNDEEAHVLTGEAEPLVQAEAFRALGCGTVVITRGGHGTLVRTADTVQEAPVYPVTMVDGSGAGDAFAAGFLLGLLEGWDLPETLRFASAEGASVCTRLGCTTGAFTRPQAEAFVQQHPLDIRVSRVAGS